MFHCFNISKHISISVLFFIISVSCFFAGNLKIIVPGLGSEHDFSVPGIGVSHFLRAQEVGNLFSQKISRGFALGGVRLGID